MPKTFTADQITPYFAKDNPSSNTKFATYRFYEHKRWDGKEMLMIEIKLTNAYPDRDDGKIIPKELLEDA